LNQKVAALRSDVAEAGDGNLVGLVVALVCAMVGLAVANAHREDA
jgi:hypothetical protein